MSYGRVSAGYRTMKKSMAAILPRVLGLALGYWGMAQLLSALATPPGFAAPIWPSAGIALGALVAWGLRVWPGILIGSFIFNFACLSRANNASAVWLMHISRVRHSVAALVFLESLRLLCGLTVG